MYKIEYTAEEIKQQYESTLHSVELINKLKAKESLTKEETDTLNRNKQHVEIMLKRDYWTTEDLDPFRTAIL
jgi:hypothetical protein